MNSIELPIKFVLGDFGVHGESNENDSVRVLRFSRSFKSKKLFFFRMFGKKELVENGFNQRRKRDGFHGQSHKIIDICSIGKKTQNY